MSYVDLNVKDGKVVATHTSDAEEITELRKRIEELEAEIRHVNPDMVTPEGRVRAMSNLDIRIEADNELAYEQGFIDALNILIKKTTLERDLLLEPKTEKEQDVLYFLQQQVDTLSQHKDIKYSIAWAQDHGMFGEEQE